MPEKLASDLKFGMDKFLIGLMFEHKEDKPKGKSPQAGSQRRLRGGF